MAKISDDEDCPCLSGVRFGDCHGPQVRGPVLPTITKRRQLRVIPEPDPNTRAVFEIIGGGTVWLRGFGNLSSDCGSCGAPLAEGIEPDQVNDVVVKCAACDAFNEF